MGILIGDAGLRGRPGGKPTWGPPGQDALRRLLASRRRSGADSRRIGRMG
ncbi:hypothetical protein ACWDOP_05830 [Nocardia sp. NPDC003693]